MALDSVPLVDCCLEEYRRALRKCLLNQKLYAMPEPKFNIFPEGELARIHQRRQDDDVVEEGQIEDEEEDDGEEAGGDNISKVKKMLTMADIQAFIIALLLPEPRLSTPPKWCRVIRCMRAPNVGIFVLDNADLSWLGESPFIFDHVFKFEEAPNWINLLINVPLSKRQQTKTGAQTEDASDRFNPTAPLKENIPRTSLLLSPIQMIVEGFPIPDFDDNVTQLRSQFKEVKEKSPMFAIDCEMCLTDAKKSELTRISMVDEECEIVYDSYVKPPNRIVDYLTKYSGITKEILDPVETTLEDVKRNLRKILPKDAILCGHSLNNDLQALNVFHPYIIDTSVIYNLTGWRPFKPSLKGLAYNFLQREIQNNRKTGHDSIEDAMTAMELVNLKLAHNISFGDQVVKDVESGVKYDVRTGMAHMPINQFVGRHNTQLVFGEMDTSPNSRFFYIYDDDDLPVGDQIKDTIKKLIETKSAICVVLTATGLCYVKF